MSRMIVLCSCIAIAMGLGCAISDYALITDNDQVSNGKGSGVVNTNGKAKIIPFWSGLGWTWPDGTDEMFTLVDQDAAGDRTLTTYNNFSSGTGPLFLDDLYCNPDWQGCAIFTASDPESGDVDPFDGTLNANCSGARSLISLNDSGRYYGECGRSRISLTDRLALMNMGEIAWRFGREGLLLRLDARNTTLRATTDSGSTLLPFRGTADVFHSKDGNHVDLTNPLLANVGRAYADFQSEFGSGATTVTLTYNGLSFDRVLGSGPLGTREEYATRIANMMRRHY